MNVQRMRSSTERWPLGAPSRVGRQKSIVKWAKGPRTYTMGNGRRVLPNLGTVILRGNDRGQA